MNFSIVVLTLNPGNVWDNWIIAINGQTVQPNAVLVIDSCSKDNTRAKSSAAGFEVHIISGNEFNHGGTRQLGVSLLPETELFVFLTQDAVLANPNALEKIISIFDRPDVGAAYGRQLPRIGAKSFESHARLFNYPESSRLTSMDDVPRLGVKAAFISNSFAAYRREALMAVGGFPQDVIVSEDTYVSAKMLLSGWKIAYCADALVYHSHDYSPVREFQRYFDIGVFHAHEKWLMDKLGKPESEGVRFMRSEWTYLVKSAFWRIPESILRACLKYAGYRLGLMEAQLPLWMKRKLSMQKGYWH